MSAFHQENNKKSDQNEAVIFSSSQVDEFTSTDSAQNIQQWSQDIVPSLNEFKAIVARVAFLEKKIEDQVRNATSKNNFHGNEATIHDDDGAKNNGDNIFGKEFEESTLADGNCSAYSKRTSSSPLLATSRNVGKNDKEPFSRPRLRRSMWSDEVNPIGLGETYFSYEQLENVENGTKRDSIIGIPFPRSRHLSRYDDNYDELLEMPESVYVLLFTEQFLSFPFAFAFVIACGSVAIMALVVVSYVSGGTDEIIFEIPSGVTADVRAAQYLGILVGVVMEQEIAQGLAFLRLSTKDSLLLDNKELNYGKLIFSSICRLSIGYLFLVNLILVTAAASDVITIFYNILALEFVQNIDDAAFVIAKNGMFGRKLKYAANKKHALVLKEKSSRASRFGSHFHFKFIYFMNALILLLIMTSFAIRQGRGDYRCNTITVTFGEEIWHRANVRLPNGQFQERVLLYSYFNGIYKITGTHHGYPVYTEQNKESGGPYLSTVGAEFKYCKYIGAWVFVHPDIKKSIDEFDSDKECSWLMRTSKTQQYDLADASVMRWTAWVGKTNDGVYISTICNECEADSDCNFQGICSDGFCNCSRERFGNHCEHEAPCGTLYTPAGSKNINSASNFLSLAGTHDNKIATSYGKPIYVMNNLRGKPFDLMSPKAASKNSALSSKKSLLFQTGNSTEGDSENQTVSLTDDNNDDYFSDDDFFDNQRHLIQSNYSVVLVYTGSRWFGAIHTSESNVADTYNSEYHGFWNETFSDLTFIVSSPTSEGTPIGAEFFETRRRNEIEWDFANYGPFGVLIQLVNVDGAGFFQCYEKLIDHCLKRKNDDICTHIVINSTHTPSSTSALLQAPN